MTTDTTYAVSRDQLCALAAAARELQAAREQIERATETIEYRIADLILAGAVDDDERDRRMERFAEDLEAWTAREGDTDG
jgi:diphthamide synthase (EF-2-diphthine--ammonia ligase)